MSKVWLVTGSASGLGRSITEAKALRGSFGVDSAKTQHYTRPGAVSRNYFCKS